MIELRLWRSFVVLAEELNFRRAAERVGISQPALTKQIQELESRLGAPLFRREARGVTLTEAAVAGLDGARALIASAQALETGFAAAQRSADASVRLGMLEFFPRGHLSGVLQKMRALHPDARISIVEVNTYEAAAAVADGRIDLGIARAPITELNLIAKPYRRGHWVLILPAAHRLAEKTRLSVTDLAEAPLIFVLRRLNPELFDTVIGAIEATGKRVDIAYQAQDPMIGVELAANGIGHALTVSFALGPIPEGVVARPVDGIALEPMLDLVWRSDRMTPVLRALIDAFQEDSGR